MLRLRSMPAPMRTIPATASTRRARRVRRERRSAWRRRRADTNISSIATVGRRLRSAGAACLAMGTPPRTPDTSLPRPRRMSWPVSRSARYRVGARMARSLEDRMGALEGRVAVITGSGRGIGREHALLFAAEGAKVVVNDVGTAMDGSGSDLSPAEQVVAEITAAGGSAVANHDDVADWEGGKRLIDTALSAFGELHVLVNNAGILRDRVLVNMSEEEWDSVIHVHLKGHFVPTRHAAAHWREQAKAGVEVKASVINTSSTSGLLGNPGQTNYGAAKAGIAAFSVIC